MSSTRHHTVFDLDAWIERFPIDVNHAIKLANQQLAPSPEGALRVSEISSPVTLAHLEQTRRHIAQQYSLKGTPTDIFVFAKGEPNTPYLTKLGGTPYWPADRAVPVNDEGEPLQFVAQLCYLDSRDLFSEKQPGEVLVIFSTWYSDDEDGWFDFFGGVQGLWVTRAEVDAAGLAHGLESPLDFVAHGQIHRTMDYATEEGTDAFYQEIESQAYLLPALAATRIGPNAFHPQRHWSETPENEIGCLYSFHPNSTWPFVNMPYSDRASAGQFAEFEPGYELLIGDVGGIYFELEEDGTVSVEADGF